MDAEVDEVQLMKKQVKCISTAKKPAAVAKRPAANTALKKPAAVAKKPAMMSWPGNYMGPSRY